MVFQMLNKKFDWQHLALGWCTHIGLQASSSSRPIWNWSNWPNSKSAISGLDAEGSRGFIKVGRRPWHFAKQVFNSFVQQPLQFATFFARRDSFLCQMKDLKASRISFQIVDEAFFTIVTLVSDGTDWRLDWYESSNLRWRFIWW